MLMETDQSLSVVLSGFEHVNKMFICCKVASGKEFTGLLRANLLESKSEIYSSRQLRKPELELYR